MARSLAGITALLTFSIVATSAPVPKERERSRPVVAWHVKDGLDKNQPHDPLVVGDKVLVGTDGGELRAYRCKDGTLAWKHDHGSRIYHRPSSDGERVYFTSEKGMTAVSVKDGKEAWALGLARYDGPTVALAKQGLAYVGGSDGKLHAVDTKTGKVKWASDFMADAPTDPPGFPGAKARLASAKARPAALASDGAAVYVSVFDQSRLVAVDAVTGKRLWSFQTKGWVHGPAVATEKHVFIGSQDKSFYCLDKKDGKKVWSYETGRRVEAGGAVDDRFVYFGSCDGYLYCLSQEDGKLRWRTQADLRDGRASAIYSVPVLTQASAVFAAAEGQVYAIDRVTGKARWKLRPAEKSAMYCTPATDGERFFLVTQPQGGPGDPEGEPSLLAIELK